MANNDTRVVGRFARLAALAAEIKDTAVQEIGMAINNRIDKYIARQEERAAEEKDRRWREKWLDRSYLPGGEGNWVGARVFKESGGGVAGLWLAIEAGTIVDRMVVKEVWYDHDYLSDVNSFPGNESIPREAAIHALLSSDIVEPVKAQTTAGAETGRISPAAIAGSARPARRPIGTGSGVVKYRNQRITRRWRAYRVFMDYASSGDLGDLVKGYRGYKYDLIALFTSWNESLTTNIGKPRDSTTTVKWCTSTCLVGRSQNRIVGSFCTT